jgi:hypothetical protein
MNFKYFILTNKKNRIHTFPSLFPVSRIVINVSETNGIEKSGGIVVWRTVLDQENIFLYQGRLFISILECWIPNVKKENSYPILFGLQESKYNYRHPLEESFLGS